MNKRIVSILSILMLSVSLTWSLRFEGEAQPSSDLIRVPTDYETIQAAINAANPGDSIIVAPGTYYENVVINKTLSLMGETKEITIIDGNGTGIVVTINASNVNLSGFTITRSGQHPWTDSGIFISFGSANNNISNNIVRENYHGVFFEATNGNVLSFNNISSNTGRAIYLESSWRNTISANIISLNEQDTGIELFDSANNIIKANTVSENGWGGIYLQESSKNVILENTISSNYFVGIYFETSSYNVLYRNNFVDNGLNELGQMYSFESSNTWDNGAEGNYWNEYDGTDANGDGIGDTNTPHLEVDSYPLIEPWSSLRTFPADGNIITIFSNSTVASFNFNQILAQINFNVTGQSGTLGFCNVTVPKSLLKSEPPTKVWTVTLNGAYTSFFPSENATHTSLYFTYAHSTRRIQIRIVEIPNIPPTADFTFAPANPTPYDFVNFTDASFDSDGIDSWLWEFGDGQNSTEQNATHRYANAGSYIVTLKVTDNLGMETITSQALVVRKVATTLTTVAPSTVDQGELFTITATLKDENDDPVENATIEVYMFQEKWDKISSDKTNASGIASITYTPLLNAGTYKFKALFNGTQILDESSSTLTVEITAVIDTEPPKADAGVNQTVYVGVPVFFDASGSSDNIGITSYNWNFGDGTTGTGMTANHTYKSPAKYTVTLTVRDLAGNTDSDTITITVLSAEVFPTWIIGLMIIIVIVAVVAVLILLKKRR